MAGGRRSTKDKVLRTKQCGRPEMTKSGPIQVLAYLPLALSFVLVTLSLRHSYNFGNIDITNWQLTAALLAKLDSRCQMRMVELVAAGERCICEIAYWPTRHQDRSEATPATATRADIMAAAKSSPPLTRAALLAPARHGQSAADPDSTKARGKVRSNRKTPPVAASPIRPIQTRRVPRVVTTFRTAAARVRSLQGRGDGLRWPGCTQACRSEDGHGPGS
jgi:hypothetical protein